MAGRPQHRIARCGVARTYQTPRVFAEMAVQENVSLVRDVTAAQGREAGSVDEILERLELSSAKGMTAELPPARQRLLEIGWRWRRADPPPARRSHGSLTEGEIKTVAPDSVASDRTRVRRHLDRARGQDSPGAVDRVVV